MAHFERHGRVRATQWHKHGDHHAVRPGVRTEGGMLDIVTAASYARRHVEPGDWIVTESDGTMNVVTDAEFRRNYKDV